MITNGLLVICYVIVCKETLYCPITNECLSSAAKPLCNGRFDCPDESDEQNCPGTSYYNVTILFYAVCCCHDDL